MVDPKLEDVHPEVRKLAVAWCESKHCDMIEAMQMGLQIQHLVNTVHGEKPLIEKYAIDLMANLELFVNSTYTGCTKEALNALRRNAERLIKIIKNGKEN